ncbi:MAG: hypothetical protein WCP96_18165 [Methylococcaceae bacterium]
MTFAVHRWRQKRTRERQASAWHLTRLRRAEAQRSRSRPVFELKRFENGVSLGRAERLKMGLVIRDLRWDTSIEIVEILICPLIPEFFMHAIELEAIAQNGKIIVSIPEAYREQWNDKPVRVIIMATDEPVIKPKQSLLSSIRQIKVSGPEDFSENLDAYLSGEKHV